MVTLRPLLAVADVDEAASFYCDKLGFELQFSLQDKSGATFFASLSIFDCIILLRLEQARDVPPSLRRRVRADVTISITLPADIKIDGFCAGVAAKGVTITEALEDKFWGNREFSIQDPDGYCLAFAQSKHDVSIDEAQDISAQLDMQPPAADD